MRFDGRLRDGLPLYSTGCTGRAVADDGHSGASGDSSSKAIVGIALSDGRFSGSRRVGRAGPSAGGHAAGGRAAPWGVADRGGRRGPHHPIPHSRRHAVAADGSDDRDGLPAGVGAAGDGGGRQLVRLDHTDLFADHRGGGGSAAERCRRSIVRLRWASVGGGRANIAAAVSRFALVRRHHSESAPGARAHPAARIPADDRVPDAQPAASGARVRAGVRRRGDPGATPGEAHRRVSEPAGGRTQVGRRASRHPRDHVSPPGGRPFPRPGRYGRSAVAARRSEPERSAAPGGVGYAHVLRRSQRGGHARHLSTEPRLHAFHRRAQARRRPAFRELNGALAIETVPVGFAAYFEELGRVGLVERNVGKTVVNISGTKMREILRSGQMPDERVMRRCTAEVLAQYYQRQPPES
eukprot:ctg_876.g318